MPYNNHNTRLRVPVSKAGRFRPGCPDRLTACLSARAAGETPRLSVFEKETEYTCQDEGFFMMVFLCVRFFKKEADFFVARAEKRRRHMKKTIDNEEIRKHEMRLLSLSLADVRPERGTARWASHIRIGGEEG